MNERERIIFNLRDLPEYEIVNHIGELEAMKKILSLNFASLKAHINRLPELEDSTPAGVFNLSIYAKIEKQQYNQQSLQHLNNYLSSAFSLIDYTRKHFEKYYGIDKIPNYQPRVKSDFEENPLHKFIQEFRSYIVHYGVPQLSTVSQAHPVGDKFETRHWISINLNHLIKSSFNWKTKSKEFIKNQASDKIELLSVLGNHYTLLSEFQVWYKKEQQKLYHKELGKIEMAENEFSSLMFNDLMKFIRSGKGFNYQMVENQLLYCFNHNEQIEILSIEDIDKRLNKMLEKIRTIDGINFQDIFILQMTLSKNKESIK
jgi:hypothetical protein